jgi:hypothetical protein
LLRCICRLVAHTDTSLRRVKFGSNRGYSGHCADAQFSCRAYLTTSSCPRDGLPYLPAAPSRKWPPALGHVTPLTELAPWTDQVSALHPLQSAADATDLVVGEQAERGTSSRLVLLERSQPARNHVMKEPYRAGRSAQERQAADPHAVNIPTNDAAAKSDNIITSVGETAATHTIATRATILPTVKRRNISPSINLTGCT